MTEHARIQETILAKVKSLVEKDAGMRGCWVVGSMATGEADRYSDVDVYLLTDENDFESVYDERASFARNIGEVLSTFEVEWSNCSLYGVILQECVEIDLCYTTPERTEIFGSFRVLADRDGELKEFLEGCRVDFETDIDKDLIRHLDLSAYNILHAINMLGRGECWSSIRQVEILRGRIIGLVSLRTGSDTEEYRRLETILDIQQEDALQKTLCSYDPDSISEAIRTAIELFVREAEDLCSIRRHPSPAPRYRRLLEHLTETSSHAPWESG